jgi:hypothetical protein
MRYAVVQSRSITHLTSTGHFYLTGMFEVRHFLSLPSMSLYKLSSLTDPYYTRAISLTCGRGGLYDDSLPSSISASSSGVSERASIISLNPGNNRFAIKKITLIAIRITNIVNTMMVLPFDFGVSGGSA